MLNVSIVRKLSLLCDMQRERAEKFAFWTHDRESKVEKKVRAPFKVVGKIVIIAVIMKFKAFSLPRNYMGWISFLYIYCLSRFRDCVSYFSNKKI